MGSQKIPFRIFITFRELPKGPLDSQLIFEVRSAEDGELEELAEETVAELVYNFPT